MKRRRNRGRRRRAGNKAVVLVLSPFQMFEFAAEHIIDANDATPLRMAEKGLEGGYGADDWLARRMVGEHLFSSVDAFAAPPSNPDKSHPITKQLTSE